MYNYSNADDVANEIANAIESRGGYVGTGNLKEVTSIPTGSGNGKNLAGNPFDQKTLEANMYNSPLDMARRNRGNKFDNIIDDIKAGKAPSKEAQTLGITAETTSAQAEAMRMEYLKGMSNSDVNFMDKMAYHKVPQKAVGIGGTAWLVSRLDSNKGQQSNAQLYGQQPL